jgi:hypothetical protein
LSKKSKNFTFGQFLPILASFSLAQPKVIIANPGIPSPKLWFKVTTLGIGIKKIKKMDFLIIRRVILAQNGLFFKVL